MKVLQAADALFFANSQGSIPVKDLSITMAVHGLLGWLETDFSVFWVGQYICLEVDRRHYQQSNHTFRDYTKERMLLREWIPTVCFLLTQDCLARPEDSVSESLNTFPI